MDVLASLEVLLNMQADRIARVRQLQALFVLKCTRGRQPAIALKFITTRP